MSESNNNATNLNANHTANPAVNPSAIRPLNVAITGGGTGGHLSIARALGVECVKRGFSTIYIGSQSGQDRAWFESADIFSQKYFLDSTGVVNKRGFGIIKSLFLQLKAVFKAREILKKHSVDFVVSVGGFSAGGASGAAILGRIPLFIHEQNSVLGTLNKALSPFAKAVFGSFELKLKNFVRTAYPINDIFVKTARVRKKVGTILFLGGSQGAVAINDFALQLAPKLLKRDIKIIHQCGAKDFERVKKTYNDLLGDFGANIANSADLSTNLIEDENQKITLFAFDENIVRFIESADLCVSRAGASSLWELVANALPCYFVPYPFAAKNHQLTNALFLKQQGLCEVVEQKNLSAEAFFSYLDSADFATISANLKNLKSKNGAEEILDLILERVATK